MLQGVIAPHSMLSVQGNSECSGYDPVRLERPMWQLQAVIIPWMNCAIRQQLFCFFFVFLWWVTGEFSTLRQMMKVPKKPGLSPNNGLENAFLSDQSMASNPRKGQAKRFGAKTTSHDGKAGHVMTLVCHRDQDQCGSVPTVSYGLCSWFPSSLWLGC